MYDAIVVGARCAGSPTARLLARNGYKVLLVDRAGFPSDTMSVHYIHQPGIARLRHWGLLDQVIASNCPPVTGMKLDLGPFVLEGTPPPSGDEPFGYAPRRTVLDKILVDAAAAAGVEVRERFTITELVMDGDRVTGIRGHEQRGATVTEMARIVIGADGLRSFVARAVQAPEYNTQPAVTCAYYSYWDGMPLTQAELYPRPNRMIVAGPTNNDQTLVIVYWPIADFPTIRTDIELHFMRAVDEIPALAKRVRAGRRTEHFRGTSDLRGVYRKPFGPGWALVGDAGYHKDPITAQGITDAFRDAELLAEAIDAGFSSGRRMLDTLAAYEAARNAATMPMYELTNQFAMLQPPPPQMQQLMGALQHEETQRNRYFGLLAGTVAIPDFFAPENLGQIMARAA
jgi:2-polyprenyl-6-methoxyphenol hydroxylase-like FAD-dependent oxidoreductase